MHTRVGEEFSEKITNKLLGDISQIFLIFIRVFKIYVTLFILYYPFILNYFHIYFINPI